ncbi:hypothetical protein DdX_18507 [Ditylenchus destructor]|uniref:Uncharacterized protein n=1 Tax=Ditylenchus destructor TaxID=166010 RepID=A0AAD4MJN7_9BILA|nr:hypothetical protein DdX_18507 [Ditylenchus destructor]
MQTFTFPSKLFSTNSTVTPKISSIIRNISIDYALIWRILKSIASNLLTAARYYGNISSIWISQNRRTVLLLCIPSTIYLAYKLGYWWSGATVYKNLTPWVRHGPNATLNRITGIKWANAGKNAGFTFFQ